MNRKKYISIIGGCITTIIFPYVLKNADENYALTNSIYSIILFFGFFFLFDYTINNLNSRLKIYGSIWGIVTSFLLIIGANIIRTDTTGLNMYVTWIKILLLSPLMMCVFIICFQQIEKTYNLNVLKTKATDKKCFLLVWIGIFLLWLPTYLSAYPGIYGYDCIYQVQSYMNKAVHTHHPIIHTYILGFFWLN